MGSYTCSTTINAHYHQLQLESGTSRNTLFQICLGNSSVFIKLSCLCTLPALDTMYIWVQTWTCVRWRGLSIYLHVMKGILANFARSGILVGPEMIISHDTLSRREQAHWDWWDQCKILELFVSALFFWYNNCSTHDSNKRGGAVVWQICVDELTQRSLILAYVGFSETPLASVEPVIESKLLWGENLSRLKSKGWDPRVTQRGVRKQRGAWAALYTGLYCTELYYTTLYTQNYTHHYTTQNYTQNYT